MIPITTRIYSWLMQMTQARTTWSQTKIEAEYDKYLEMVDHMYNGINMYAEEIHL